MATRMLSILVAGGYDATSPGALARPVHDIQAFVQELGREIVDQGHTLLTGCRTDLDKLVAESAHARLTERDCERVPRLHHQLC
jgi:predicted Rossmann-fold nucleotide-binding protein